MHHHKYRLIVPFLLPAILLYGLFVVWPYAQAIYVSLTSWRGVSSNRPFVGLDNYQRLWQDTRFHEALGRNGQLLVVLPLVTVAIALTFAALFTQGSQRVRGAGFYRVVYFFPQIIPAVIVGILWSYIYTPNIGLLNGVLRAAGLEGLTRSWLTDPATVLWAIVAVAIWSSVGFYMVIFLASMQSIPASFYEAAILDGATRWTSFKDITFPLIWETLRTSIIYLAIAALDFFILVVVVSGGSTTMGARRAEVAAVYLYNQAFDSSRWGYASAIGVVLLILTLLLSVVIMRVTRRETYEF
ncbi:MAG: sugar ABC transporter permease [Thermomicrobiales bacterium]|nr:sugar ABC transporter permease [Thermomicrobiales bacterium]